MKVPAHSTTGPSKKKPLPRDASSPGPFRSPARDHSSMDASRKQDIAEVEAVPWWDQQADCSDSIPDAFLHDNGAQSIPGMKSGRLVPSIGDTDRFPCLDADQDHSDYLKLDGGTQPSPRKPPRPIVSLSQNSGHSQEELCFAEVNPVTFELAPNIASHEPPQKESCEKWGHLGLQDITGTLSETSSSHILIGNCSILSMPEGHGEHPTTHQAKLSSTAKLICSYGGKIMPRPVDGKLRYVGGETRIVTVNRSIDLHGFLSKMMQYYRLPLRFKYQLPGEDLDALISVSSDEDWQNMMEEHDKIESSGGLSRLRLFFFTSPAELEVQQAGLKNEADDGCVDLDHRFINAVNGVQGKFCMVGLDDEAALPRVSENLGRSTHHEVANARTYSKGPSLPSSAPSSPPFAPRHDTDLKSIGVDSSLHIPSDHLSKVMIKPHGYEGDANQDGSGSSSGISYYDHHYHVATDSPRMALHDVAISRCENWQVSETGMHRVDSKSRLIHQSEHQTELQLDRRTPFAYPEQRPHMQQPSEMLLTPGESQHFLQHHKQNLQQQQQQQPLLPAWQSQMKGNVGRVETAKHALSDMHIQHHILPQSHHQAPYHCLHHVAGCEGNAWNAEHFAGPSFYQGSRQGHGQIPPGLSPAPPYQIGADALSPRALTSDYLGRCSCGQQHSHVHRGISVSIGDQSHMRRPPHFPDQSLRKHGLNSSSRFLDSCSHCGESHVWHQHSHFGGSAEVEEGEQLWQQANGRHIPENHMQEVRSKNRLSLYHDPAFAETLLASNGRLDSNKSKHTCMECHDPRVHEKVMLHQGYTDTQNKVVNIAMQRRHGELEGLNDPFSKRLAFEHIPNKDGDARQGFEEDNFVGGQSCFGVSQAGGDHSQKRTQAMPVELTSQHGKFSTYAVPVSRPPIIENPHVSQTAGQAQSQWRSNVTDSWALSSLDPRLYPDVIPSGHVHTVNEADSAAFGTPISSHTSDFMLTHRKINNPSVIDQPTENHGQGHGAAVTESFKWEKNSRPPSPISPISIVGEAEAEPSHVSSVCFDMVSCECGVRVPAMHGGARLSGVDGIPAGRLAPLRTTPAVSVTGLGVPAANLSMATSLNSPASPVYDQSPLSSLNSTEFCFGQNGTGCIQDAVSSDEAALTSCMSLTEQLADGMISSVLNSDQGPSRTSKNADRKVDHMPSKQVVVNTSNGKAARSLAKEENATSTPITEQDRSWSVTESSAVNGWLKVGMDERQLAREAPVVLNDAIDELTDGVPQVKGDEADGICTKETEESASSQAEAEARARGLQIIKNADLEELKELGSGTFGTVFHGKWRGSDVAIKRIKASCFVGSPSLQERLIADFWKEACTLAQLHHPNIVAFYGVVPDGPGGTLGTVTEYMVNGSLKQVLHKKDRTIDRRKRLFIAMDAAFGMEYLHSKQIVHFDLKCENLLVNMRDAHRPICKVGDFGLSKVKHNTLVSGGVRGTLPWMAPELLTGNCGMVSNKVDVYSFGIVMWELLTGEEPYAKMHCGEIIGGIVNNTLRLTIPSWCDPGWRSLMERCWSHDPSERPAFSDVAKELREIAASMNIK